MRGIRKNTNCVRCGKKLDREGDLCQECMLKSAIKVRQRTNRDNHRRSIQLKQMKKEVYDKILKEVNKELDEEESERRK